MVSVEGRALKTAHVVARFKIETVQSLYTAGTCLKHAQAISPGLRFIFK